MGRGPQGSAAAKAYAFSILSTTSVPPMSSFFHVALTLTSLLSARLESILSSTLPSVISSMYGATASRHGVHRIGSHGVESIYQQVDDYHRACHGVYHLTSTFYAAAEIYQYRILLVAYSGLSHLFLSNMLLLAAKGAATPRTCI